MNGLRESENTNLFLSPLSTGENVSPEFMYTLRSLLILAVGLLLTPVPAFPETFSAVPSETVITLTGYTRPETVVEISSEVSGRCVEVFADQGDPIPTDNIFARIDDTFITLEIESNALSIGQAERQLQFDRNEVQRYTQLVAEKSSSQITLDSLILRQDLARNLLEQLNNRKRTLAETRSRHRITAPAGWLITNRSIEPGEWVNAGQPVARAGYFDQLIIPVALTPEELIAAGNTDISLVQTDSGIRLKGRLGKVNPDFDPLTRKTEARIRLDMSTLPEGFPRRGGARLQASLRIPEPTGSYLVPEKAVSQRYEEHWLTRTDGSTIRVIVLGPEPSETEQSTGRLRITSPEINVGDLFLMPGETR